MSHAIFWTSAATLRPAGALIWKHSIWVVLHQIVGGIKGPGYSLFQFLVENNETLTNQSFYLA